MISWASIDYYGREKAVQYSVKRYYQNLYIFAKEVKDKVEFYLLNDEIEDLHGVTARIDTCNMNGECHMIMTMYITSVLSSTSNLVLSLDPKEAIPYGKNHSVLKMSISYFEKVNTNYYFFHPLMANELGDPNLQIDK